jgi:hypothetical protein
LVIFICLSTFFRLSFSIAVTDKRSDNGYQLIPTLFWLNSSDAAVWTGALVSVLISIGRWQRPALVAGFVLYLSLY